MAASASQPPSSPAQIASPPSSVQLLADTQNEHPEFQRYVEACRKRIAEIEQLIRTWKEAHAKLEQETPISEPISADLQTAFRDKVKVYLEYRKLRDGLLQQKNEIEALCLTVQTTVFNLRVSLEPFAKLYCKSTNQGPGMLSLSSYGQKTPYVNWAKEIYPNIPMVDPTPTAAPASASASSAASLTASPSGSDSSTTSSSTAGSTSTTSPTTAAPASASTPKPPAPPPPAGSQSYAAVTTAGASKPQPADSKKKV